MSEAMELLPCPFCGCKAHIRSKMLDERFGYATSVRVYCLGCLVGFEFMDDQNPKGGYALNGTAEPKSIAAWNRRAHPIASTSKENEG